jgi:hypothetical protein
LSAAAKEMAVAMVVERGRGDGCGQGRRGNSGDSGSATTRNTVSSSLQEPVILSNPPTLWEKSRGKNKLARDLLMDQDSWVHGMPATHMYCNHPLYEQYHKSNFTSNFNDLKKKLEISHSTSWRSQMTKKSIQELLEPMEVNHSGTHIRQSSFVSQKSKVGSLMV